MKKRNSKQPATPGRQKTSADGLKKAARQLKLLGYVRGKDWTNDLLKDLQRTEQELTQSYPALHALAVGSEEEEQALSRIRQLEDERFLLLGKLHGNRVDHYHVNLL